MGQIEKFSDSLWDLENNGFLPVRSCQDLSLDELTGHYQVLRQVPVYITDGSLRERVDLLPLVKFVFDYDEFDNASCVLLDREEDIESVFTLFGMLASAYVHSNSPEFASKVIDSQNASVYADVSSPDSPVFLPECVAVPLKAISTHLGRKPMLDYAGIVLTNWVAINPILPLDFDNIKILRTFTHLKSEEWFYKVHVLIEYFGGSIIKAIIGILSLTENGSVTLVSVDDETDFDKVRKVLAFMKKIANSLRKINVTMFRMKEGCSSEDFFHTIRPYLMEWPSCGVVYGEVNGADSKPVKYSGASGAQSSLLPCIDLFLGVFHGSMARIKMKHPKDDAGGGVNTDTEIQAARAKFNAALKRFRDSMPSSHRQMIETLEAGINFRDLITDLENVMGECKVKSLHPDQPIIVSESYRVRYLNINEHAMSLKEYYNECIEQLLSFRRKHLGFAISYISKQAEIAVRKAKGKDMAGLIERKGMVGSGSSHFKSHLMQHICDTRLCLYSLPSRGASNSRENLEHHSRIAEQASPVPPQGMASYVHYTPKFLKSSEYVLAGLGPFLNEHSFFGKKSFEFKNKSGLMNSHNCDNKEDES